MEITSFALNNFAPENFFGGGKFVTMNTPKKIPRMSISTAFWKRSLTNAVKQGEAVIVSPTEKTQPSERNEI